MDNLAREVLARLPLAEAVLVAWQWMADETFLEDLFEKHRGRCYTQDVRFPTLVQLIHDVLIGAADSANQSFQRARADGALGTQVSAAYEKLGRLPLGLSMAFLAGCTQRLRAVVPDPRLEALPRCCDGWTVVTLDGKAIKHVAKRLKPLRGLRGGILGGRALVAQAMASGLVLGMHADADGEANDIRFVPELVPVVRERVAGPILWVADRQFGYPEVLAGLSGDADRFVVRYHGNVKFTRDPGRPARSGVDARGRGYREDWGWLGGEQNPHRRYVRRIALDLGRANLILVTDLLDADRSAAAELLRVYRSRWGIEGVFQQITEVFGLARLIGGTPQATVFQLSFCLVLYNLTQAIRAIVAEAGQRPAAEVSGEKVFRDVRKELISWRTVLGVGETLGCFAPKPTAAAVRRRLEELLGRLWRDDWIKAKPKKEPIPHPPRPYRRGEHKSVHRALAESKHART
jgi:Transposase DDE domain